MVFIFYSASSSRLEDKPFDCLLQQLPFFMQSQILKFRKWEDRQRSLLGKILLKTGLSSMGLESYSLEDIKYNRFMKPYFDDQVDFNISHSGEFIVCAISRIHKVGVDVEEILDIPLSGFDTQFSDEEWKSILAAGNKLHAFYTLWTQKEAFLKAIGAGMNIPLNKVVIEKNTITWNNTEWFLHEIKLDRKYKSYLSTNGPSPSLVVHNIDFRSIHAS